MLALLELVDNPRQDVPLIAALRSPLFGFTPDRLAEIRVADRKGEFYDALLADGGADCAAFLSELETLRVAARDMSAYRLVWHIYNRLNVLGVFGAMDGGAMRRENLIALSRHAEKLEANGYCGLFAFVTQLRRMLEADQVPPTRSAAAMSGVRLMSIHKSKGLEFPIVFLTDLDHAFSRQDFDTAVLVHPQMGVGPHCVDLERKIKYPTLARLALEEKLRRENLSEEQRVLYVAMTRPKEKLILVDAMRYAEKRLQRLSAMASCPVLPESVAEGKNFGDWLLLPLLCRPEAEVLRELAGAEVQGLLSGGSSPWQVFVHDAETLRPQRYTVNGKESALSNDVMFDPALLEYQYPYQRGALVPAKVTATQFKGRLLDEEIAEDAPRTPYIRPLTQPKFCQIRRGLTAAERGTATHLVLQYLDFANLDAAGQVEQLRQRELLTAEQAAAVDIPAMDRFLRSDLAREICGSETVLREYRFTLLVDARICDPTAPEGDQVLLQGVVDCCFETAEGLTVVDFKTDHLASLEDMTRRAEEYRPQLEAYTMALEQVLEKRVCRRVLYFLERGEWVEV